MRVHLRSVLIESVACALLLSAAVAQAPREETNIFLPWQHGKNNDATNRGFLTLFGYDRVRSLGDGGWIEQHTRRQLRLLPDV